MTLLRNLVAVLVTLVAHLPATVVGECTCDAGDDKDVDRGKALRYKLGALASILVAGGIGVVLPMLGRALPALRPEKDLFFVVKAFAAGVILATGFIHVLPDAFKNLTNPCLPDKPWADFPFTGFTAMAAAIGVLSIDVYAASYYQRTHFRGEAEKVAVEEGNREKSGDGTGEHAGHVHVHTHATHGHSHGASTVSSAKDSGALETLRHRVVSQVLELGIVVHSVIIGVSLGASESISTIKPLIAALSFHQFFEGMGLGGCITQAKFKGVEATVMGLFFCLTTPIGIAVGIAISSRYDENSHTALIVEGVLNAASAGILIYMALVDLIAADFMSPRMQSNGRLLSASNLALLVGAGCMSLLAKWA